MLLTVSGACCPDILGSGYSWAVGTGVVSELYISGATVLGLSGAEEIDVLMLVVKPTESSVQVPVVCGTVNVDKSSRREVFSDGHGVVAPPDGGATVVNDTEVRASEETRTELNVLGASGAGPTGEIKPPVCCASVPGASSEEVKGSEAAESTDGAGVEVICDVIV